MLPRPDQPVSLASLPWACLAFFLVYLLIFVSYQRNELEQQQTLAEWYQQSGLFELEWKNYISWLRISGQVEKARSLEAARSGGDKLTIFRAMAFDPEFERENRLRGDQYWDASELIKWEETRRVFLERAGELPSVRMGLNPAAPRPSTYLTWHFLHENLWQWLVALAVLLPFAWPLEAELGRKRLAILWMVSGVVVGLIYVALMQHSYQPMVGATPVTAALIGMYLSLFGIRRLPFRYFHPKQKEWRDLYLPAAVLAPLWFALPLYEYLGGSPAPHVWAAQVAGLLIGAGLVQLARRSELDNTEEDNAEEDTGVRQLRQHLTSAWASMSALSFREAEEEFNKALVLSPGHFPALTGLYHIRKLHPDGEQFHATAIQVLDATADSEGDIRQQLALYRDYIKRLGENQTLPMDTEVQLLMRFTRIGELKDAEKLASGLLQRREEHELLVKALTNLAQAFRQYNNAGKANQFETLAGNLKVRTAS